MDRIEQRRIYAREYIKRPEVKEKRKIYARERRAKVIAARGYKRKPQEDNKISESYRKRNATRYQKNKITWKNKEIIRKQNERIKEQYRLYL